MRVPNAENAVIDIRKLRDYVLNPDYVEGRHKAILWRAALNISAVDAEELSPLLLEAVRSNDGKIGKLDDYGQRYTVDFVLEWRGKSAIIRAGWIIRHGSNVPRLTTAFPG